MKQRPNLDFLFMRAPVSGLHELWLHCEGYYSVVDFAPTESREHVLGQAEEAMFNLPCTIEETEPCLAAISDNLAPILVDAKKTQDA